MHQALAWAVATGAFLLFAGMVQRARAASGGGRKAAGARRDGFLAHRRRLREMREKHRLDGDREKARDERARQREEARDERARQREADREERQRERDREQYGDDGQPPRRNIRSVIRLRPEKPDDGGTEEAGGTGKPPARDDGEAPREPEPPAHRKPPPDPPLPPTPPRPTGGTAVTSPAIRTGIEDLIGAIDRIRAAATAGNAKAKLAALRACSAACTGFAQMAMTLARQMAEQGHYGPEITERVSAAGIHLTAAASAFSDSANGVATLLNMRLGDLPESGRQAPHHAELSETGAR